MEGYIAIFAEERGGALRKASLEVLSRAATLKDLGKMGILLLLFGKQLDAALKRARSYADRVVPVTADPETLRVDSVLPLLQKHLHGAPCLFFFSSATPLAVTLLSHISSELSIPFVSQAVDMKIEDGNILFKKPLFGGKIFVWLEAKTPLAVAFRSNTFPIREISLNGSVVEEESQLEEDSRIRICSVEERNRKAVSLEEADFVICGGLGLKEARNFDLLEEIAEKVGGAVGASRGAVDAGLRPYEDQIGKSGKTVSPKVYIGCGVSGAIHHIMGVDTSRIIVAINKDREAPIFKHSDYGIVDDLFQILPILKEALKKLKS